MDSYTQCFLIKVENDLRRVQTAYVPSRFAVKGKALKLKDPRNNEWTDGWQVSEVYASTLDKLPHLEGSVRRHRNRTGDNLKKQTEG